MENYNLAVQSMPHFAFHHRYSSIRMQQLPNWSKRLTGVGDVIKSHLLNGMMPRRIFGTYICGNQSHLAKTPTKSSSRPTVKHSERMHDIKTLRDHSADSKDISRLKAKTKKEASGGRE